MKLSIRGFTVNVDVEATRATYAALAAASTDPCQCAYCRNFRALGASAFPEDILAFFASAGIDPGQPAEVYEYHETRPGYHLYGGEYYFWGAAMLETPQPARQDDFELQLTERSPVVPDLFNREGAVCFEFTVELPWGIGGAV